MSGDRGRKRTKGEEETTTTTKAAAPTHNDGEVPPALLAAGDAILDAKRAKSHYSRGAAASTSTTTTSSSSPSFASAFPSMTIAAPAPPPPSTGSSTTTKKTSSANKLSALEERLEKLQEENSQLRMQLKLGREATTVDEEERRKFTDQLAKMIENKAPETEIAETLQRYVFRFSDYGPERANFVAKHLEQLDRLLSPTPITKLCLWALHEEESSFFVTEPGKDLNDGPPSLWRIMCQEIDATPAQQEKFKTYRESAKALTRGLRFTNRETNDLRDRIHRKNKALQEEMEELQEILTPTQIAKFLLYCNKNPASMAMLDRLWSPRSSTMPGPNPASSQSSSSASSSSSSSSSSHG